MCGIVACQTTRPALDFLMSGLRRLEYRGYDSAGVAVRTEGGDIVRLRSVGRLDALEAEVADYRGSELAGAGIGHTRWATHGTVSTENSHPHIDCGGQVNVVHNGIIENADELRSQLMLRGHTLRTEVDSEVVAHLVEEALSGGADLTDAVDKATSALLGSWALAVVRTGESAVVLTAQRSPLVVATVRTPRATSRPWPDGQIASRSSRTAISYSWTLRASAGVGPTAPRRPRRSGHCR
jgi:glucosamine--fructose-6-phosphate aminotransferase (isomerizing)